MQTTRIITPDQMRLVQPRLINLNKERRRILSSLKLRSVIITPIVKSKPHLERPLSKILSLLKDIHLNLFLEEAKLTQHQNCKLVLKDLYNSNNIS